MWSLLRFLLPFLFFFVYNSEAVEGKGDRNVVYTF